MLRTLTLPLLSIVLVAGLLFPPIAAYTAVYAVLGSLVIGLVFLSPRYWEIFDALPFRFIWLGLALLMLTLPFAYKDASDLSFLAALIPIFIAPALVMLLREEPRFASPLVIGTLCLAGAIGAVSAALNDVLFLGLARAGGGNNSIHFASISLIVSFMALIGLFGSKSAWRFLFLTGPAFGMAAVFLSGSRGPILAGTVLTIAIFPFIFFWFWREKAFKIMLAIGLIVGLGLSTQIDGIDVTRAANIFNDIGAVFDANAQIDGATQERLVLYQAAWEAFKQAPVFGYGSGHFATEAGKFMPDAYANMRGSEHLHSDIADFATIGGVVGLLAYLCLLSAPLFVFRGVYDVNIRRALMLGGIVMAVGYFALGLTNAVFGILPQTMLFGVLLGVLVGMAQVKPDTAH